MTWVLTLHSNRSPKDSPLVEVRPESRTSFAGLVAENRTYWWLLCGRLNSPYEVRLFINGLELARDIAAPDTIWFRWDIGFNAGFVDVVLTGLGSDFSERVIIDPSRNKLVRRDFRLMLRDIIADTRSLASTSGMREGLSRGDKVLPIATLEFILESSASIQRLVRDLDKNHQRRLARSRQQVPLHEARGLSSGQWNESRRYGKPVDTVLMARLPNQMRSLVVENRGMFPSRVVQAKIVRDSRRRENTEVLGFLYRLVSELRRSAGNLSSQHAGEGERVLARQCRKMAGQISSLLDLTVFNSLSPHHGRWQHSHLYQRVEPYRSLYRIYRDVNSGISGVGGNFASVPLRETFRLYETWVALRLTRAAALLDPGLNAMNMFEDSKEANQLTLSLQATSAQFSGNTLRFKPVFSEVWLTPDGTGSYSRRMIPDIILEVLDEDKLYRNLVVLDAKYRVESELNDAISSIHTYKDALIQEDPVTEGSDKRIVVSGFVVVPAPPDGLQGASDWRTEKMPIVLFRQGYQDRFKLGAMVLTPGVDVGDIAASLQEVIFANQLPRPVHDLDG